MATSEYAYLHGKSFDRGERVYVFLASLFVVVLVLTNIVGVKLFDAFGVTLTSGIVTYPITFLLTDIVSEIWGARRANFMVFMGFFCSLIMLLIVQFVLVLEGSEVWINGSLGYETVSEMQLKSKGEKAPSPW